MKGSKIANVRETIIEESTKLFLVRGFRGTSIQDITEKTRVGRGTVYWYFKSKVEILESIFRKFETEFVDGMMEAVKACPGDFNARYRTFYKFATEFAREHRDLALASTTLLNEILGSNTETEALVKSIFNRFRHFVEIMLEDGKREGAVHKFVNTTLYAHIICASHTGMLVQWFLNGDSLNVDGFVRAFRDVLLQGTTVFSKQTNQPRRRASMGSSRAALRAGK